MRPVVWLFAACLAFAPFGATPARAGDSVDLTLVLVTDVSRSVDDAEFKLEKEGYAAAFTSQPGDRGDPERQHRRDRHRLCRVRLQLRGAHRAGLGP